MGFLKVLKKNFGKTVQQSAPNSVPQATQSYPSCAPPVADAFFMGGVGPAAPLGQPGLLQATGNAAGAPQPSTSTAPAYAASQAWPAEPGLRAQVREHLGKIVGDNGLQAFYAPARLEQTVDRLMASVNFRSLEAELGLPIEIALDLASLALYDIVLFADDSGSMCGDNWTTLKETFARVTDIARRFDSDGLDIYFFNSNACGKNIASPQQLARFMKAVAPSGGTPLGEELQSKVLAPVQQAVGEGTLEKPVLVIIFTDGAPNSRRNVFATINKMQKHLIDNKYPDKTVAYSFVQIGHDRMATEFLDTLDAHEGFGKNVDCTSSYEIESAQYKRRRIELSPMLYTVKLMVGAIDKSYDEQDEVPNTVDVQ